MSVQAGIWNFDGRPVDRAFLERSSYGLAEYGPDGEHIHAEDEVMLLYRPFYTTAESRFEKQPFVTATNKVFTWDGRLDNRDELLSAIGNELQDDRSDVAIVAAALERWGLGCLRQFVGDWALCIWDPVAKQLIMARDYIGTRPLFYYAQPKRVVWCSHLGSLVSSGDHFTISEEYIAGYLAFHPDADLTPFRELKSVPPASLVRIASGVTKVNSYWSLDSGPATIRYSCDAEYEEQYRHLFRQAVRRRLRSDSTVLAELSGGLDSSSIVCMADDLLTKGQAEAPGLDTFSYYDSQEPQEDDFIHLTRVEERRGRQGFRIDLNGQGDSLPFDCRSFSATPGFGTRAEVKIAMNDIVRSRRYRIVLTGTGGDEMNGQALEPSVLMADLFVNFRLIDLCKQLTTWSLLTRRPWIELLTETLGQLLPTAIRSRLSEQGRVEPWVDSNFAMQQHLSLRQMLPLKGIWFFRPAARDALQAVVALSRQLTNHTPPPLELRYPYLDRTLVEFLSAVPLEQLLRPGQRRSLMRRALNSLLPPEIIARKTKASAGRCYSLSLEKHWAEVEKVLTSPITERFRFVTRDKFENALLAMKNGQFPKRSLRLLKALSLELWLRDLTAHNVIRDMSQKKEGGENNAVHKTTTCCPG